MAPLTKNDDHFSKPKRRTCRMRKSITITSIGCSAALSGCNSHMQSHAFSPIPPSWCCTRSNTMIRNTHFRPVWYRDGDAMDSEERRNDHDTAALLVSNGPVSDHGPSTTKEQQNIDDYLEFLGRRYNRLHSDEKPSEESKEKVKQRSGVSFAWNWLFDESNPQAQKLHQAMREDAFYVLGVAELASNRLLQKHHSVQSHLITPHGVEPTNFEVADMMLSRTNELRQPPSSFSYELLNKILLGVMIAKKLQAQKSNFWRSRRKSSILLFMRSTKMLMPTIITPFKMQWNFFTMRLKTSLSLVLSMAISIILLPRQTFVAQKRGSSK